MLKSRNTEQTFIGKLLDCVRALDMVLQDLDCVRALDIVHHDLELSSSRVDITWRCGQQSL